MGFTLGSQGLESLMECEGLEKLAVSVPAEDIVSLPVLSNVASGWTRITVHVCFRADGHRHPAYAR